MFHTEQRQRCNYLKNMPEEPKTKEQIDWPATGRETVVSMRQALNAGQSITLTPQQIYSLIGPELPEASSASA